MVSSLGEYTPVPLQYEEQGLGSSVSPQDLEIDSLSRSPESRARQLMTFLPWLLSFVLASILLTTSLHRVHNLDPLGSYESGFKTDFITSSQIPLELVHFYGGVRFHENGTQWIEPTDVSRPWPENKRYFGPPSSELDGNWDQLIGGRYVSVSEEEAKNAWGDRRHEYFDEWKGGYTAGFDVLHLLHCVNKIRQTFWPEYYTQKNIHGIVHAEHCLDAIRQSIQCYGGTTLVPTRFREGLGHMYIDSEQVHTCRSFRYLRDWTTSRGEGNEGYVPRNRSAIDQRKHDIIKNNLKLEQGEI